MSNGLSPQEIVNRAAEIMFAQADRYTPVLQAMQKAIGIIIDDDLLIVGFDPQDNPLSGHLNASINRNRVVAALRAETPSTSASSRATRSTTGPASRTPRRACAKPRLR
jgi:hypothetical protein